MKRNNLANLNEAMIEVDDDYRIKVVSNLSADQLIAFAKSVGGKLRGLAYDDNVYWWDRHLATHHDVAKSIGYADYVDCRLMFDVDTEGYGLPCWIDDDYTRLPAHPYFRKLMRSDKILFDAGSYGDLSGPEFAVQCGIDTESYSQINEMRKLITIVESWDRGYRFRLR